MWLSNRNFGGLTGDVFGAMNEITRMVSAIVIVIILNSLNGGFLTF
ncbi:MAG: adenosylcobinamide-GDP ribazoletransferase [Promethearchaeota archaeon]